MKQQAFPLKVSKNTKGMLPAYIFGFIAAAAIIALPFVPLIALDGGTESPFSILIAAIKNLQGTNDDPTKYMVILQFVFPIMTLVLSLVTFIKLIVWLCNAGKGQVGALRMTGTYFSVVGILVSYVIYLLFFTSLLYLSPDVEKELSKYFTGLFVAFYGRYYIAYGAIAGAGILLSAIGNWTSCLTRPNAGMAVYRVIRFIGAVAALFMVLYLPVINVSYGSGKTSLMKLLAPANKDAMFAISNAGMGCNADKINMIGAFVKNAFTGGGDDATPILLAIFYVNFVPFILLIAAFSATMKTLRALVQPNEEIVYDYRADNGDELDITNYKRLTKPKKIGVGVSVFMFIAATVLLVGGFGFGPFATLVKLTSYNNLKVVIAPVLTVYLFVYGVALIVYASVYNTLLDERFAAETAALVKAEENKSEATEETVVTVTPALATAAETSDGKPAEETAAADETTEENTVTEAAAIEEAPEATATEEQSTEELTAVPEETATENSETEEVATPAEEQPAEETETTASEEPQAEESITPAEERPADEELAETTETTADEAELPAETETSVEPEQAESNAESETEAADEITQSADEQTPAPEADKETVSTAKEKEEKPLSNYERVEKEYEAYIAESNEMLRKYYKRIKALKAAAEEDGLDVAERTTREAEYERALERKRSYVYESGLIIKGYKSRLASVKELDEE